MRDDTKTLTWDYPDITQVEPLSEADDELMRELHEVLERHGALRRFGITLLHQHFALSSDEVILEETDVASRLQSMHPVKLRDLTDSATTATAWTLETGKPVMRCTCKDYGNGHVHTETN